MEDSSKRSIPELQRYLNSDQFVVIAEDKDTDYVLEASHGDVFNLLGHLQVTAARLTKEAVVTTEAGGANEEEKK